MKNDTYDLTSPQKSILLTEQFHKDTCVSNICGTLEIKQKINIELTKFQLMGILLTAKKKQIIIAN